jgi:hypothetical protein
MNGVHTGLSASLFALVFTGLGAIPAPAPGSSRSPHGGQTRPIDRWLVAAPEAADSLKPEERLLADLLAAPGEVGVLPDRGSRAAGVTWRLVRRDGAASVPLDSVFPDGGPGTVVYAHSYLRLPSDGTLRLEWGGDDCTAARAWLNGREIPTGAVDARFGAGWNTLLLKLVAADCPFGFHASLTPPGESSVTAEVEVQASRPYGDVRTGPEDWVVLDDTARIASERRWRDDRLYAGLGVGLTAWGRAPVSGVEVELRGVADGRAAAPWLVPGISGEVVVPVRLDRLDRLIEAGRIEVRLRWAGRQADRSVSVVGTKPAASGRQLVLDGWEVRRTGGADESEASRGRLPGAAGTVLEGEWRVPEGLAGRSLVLETGQAAADYRLNGSSAPSVDRAVKLCSPCTRGLRLSLSATSTDAWTAMPTVRIEGVAGGG